MESIYGIHMEALLRNQEQLLSGIEKIRMEEKARTGEDPVEHCLSRIKSEESMREKCRRKGLPETTESAVHIIHDAIGIRIVCPLISNIYLMRDAILALPGVVLEEEKDYIRHAKPNGYRSCHIILRLEDGYFAEIQLRTISMDTWAALEHQVKYKKELGENVELIVSELKRCADELASTDLSMQTIHDMIHGEAPVL